jgi:cystathionine gamma-synthase
MSAATACFLALAPGDPRVAPKVMYWSLRNWLGGFATQWGSWSSSSTPPNRSDRRRVRPCHLPAVWLETPANPTWAVTDIAAVSEIAHKAARCSPSFPPSPRRC